MTQASDKDGQTVHDGSADGDSPEFSERSQSPPPMAPAEALKRAINLSKELAAANIPNRITETGDLILDMTGFKNNEEDAFRAEILARKVLTEELDGNYDIGALFGVDEHGNLWIYSSEEAKDAALKRTLGSSLRAAPALSIDAAGDPGELGGVCRAMCPTSDSVLRWLVRRGEVVVSLPSL